MSTWLLTMRLPFLTEWSVLPANEAAQVPKKLAALAEGPIQDAETRIPSSGRHDRGASGRLTGPASMTAAVAARRRRGA
jgi:hypothetical protein